jgi:hypothetical protein
VSRCKDVKDEGARGEYLKVGGDTGGHLDAGNTDCKAAQGEQGFRGCKEKVSYGVAVFSRVQGLKGVQGTEGFSGCKSAWDERFADVAGTQEVKGL